MTAPDIKLVTCVPVEPEIHDEEHTMDDDKVVLAQLVFNPAKYFLWVPAHVDNLGCGNGGEKLESRVHIVGTDGRSLCDQYRLPAGYPRPTHSTEAWSAECDMRCMMTAVTRTGTSSSFAETNVTFMSLCTECMKLSIGVWLVLGLSKYVNNHWYAPTKLSQHASAVDYDYWRERGLNV